jgi:hypothetical protein
MTPRERIELAARVRRLVEDAGLILRELEREPEAELRPTPPPQRRPARWLTVAEVAERLGRDVRWVYRRANRWPFAVREGRALLFDERGMEAYFERHRLGDG